MENESNMSSHSSLSQTEYVPSQRTSPDTTGASDVAVTMGGTPKRTVSASFWLASEGPAACYVSGVTCAFSAQFCTACDADSGMFLTDNACHSSAALVGKCRVYATDGGCLICSAGFDWHEKTCVECDAKCRTCTDGVSCLA